MANLRCRFLCIGMKASRVDRVIVVLFKELMPILLCRAKSRREITYMKIERFKNYISIAKNLPYGKQALAVLDDRRHSTVTLPLL